jgi:hypothetical protein
MKKRAMTLLAVAGLAGAAHAEPDAPRALPTGAPACGNVMSKYGAPREDPLCPVIRNLRELEALGRNFDAELRKLDPQLPPLTLPAERRPGL